MRQISPELTDALSGEALTLCLCWRLRRRDGMVIGLTDHDNQLQVDGVDYSPGAAIEAGQFTQTAGLRPGRGAAAGGLASDAITDADLDAGLWDRTEIDVFRADWSAPQLGAVLVWTGYLAELTRTRNGSYEAELVSRKADLERPVGRVLQRRCDAVLGDARCGVTDTAGKTCDQRFATCRDVFSNTANFRGFPHIPGTDFVLSGPASTGNDGGKR